MPFAAKTLAQLLLVAAFLALPCAWAQDGPRGHWTGKVDIPNRPMNVEIDLDKYGNDWIGTISIPASGQSGIPLDAIAVANGKWTFRIKGAPGEPTFTGTPAADGKTITGDFSAGGNAFPFQFTRNGEAKITVAKAMAPVGAAFAGTWEGALDTGGATLHLKLVISNGADGAKATIFSVDQGNAELAVSSMEQTGAKLDLKIAMIGGAYLAEINKDGTELTGTWSQAANAFPLTMKKAK